MNPSPAPEVPPIPQCWDYSGHPPGKPHPQEGPHPAGAEISADIPLMDRIDLSVYAMALTE
jgi:hypothetical protein